MTKMSNEGQFAKARKAYGKDFYAKSGSDSDQALKKGAETMEKGSVKMGRFATGGVIRRAEGGGTSRASDSTARRIFGKDYDRMSDLDKENADTLASSSKKWTDDEIRDMARNKPMKRATGGTVRHAATGRFAKGGAAEMKPRHSLTEDRRDQMADRISGKKRGMSAKAFEGTPADERMDKMKSPPMNKGGAPRSKAGRYQTGGTVKPVKRNMGGMMGDPAMMDQMQRGAAGRLPPAPPPVGGQGIGNMIGTNPNPMQRGLPGGRGMATPTPMERPMQQQDFGGDQGAGGFKRGGHPKPIKRAMGGVGKQRKNEMDSRGSPKSASSRAPYSKTVI